MSAPEMKGKVLLRKSMYYYVLVSVLGASLLLFASLFLFLPLLFAWHLITGASLFFLFLYGFRVGFSQGSNCFHLEFVSAAITLIYGFEYFLWSLHEV